MTETTTPLTAAELDEIKAAVDATPKGPWFVAYFGGEKRYPQRIENHQAILIADTHEGGPEGPTRPLPEFIARCRTDVPNLLATIDYLTAQLAASEQVAAAAVGAAHQAGEHAAATVARLDETTRSRDEIRDAAIAQTAALQRYVETLDGYASDANQSMKDLDTGRGIAYAEASAGLSRLLNGLRP